MLKELDKTVGSIKSLGLHKCIVFIFIIKALDVFSLFHGYATKGNQSKLQFLWAWLTFLFSDCKLMIPHSNI